MLKTIIVERCEELPHAEWNALCGKNNPFAHIHWLKLLEDVLTDYTPCYVQIWQADQLVAGLVCHPQRHFHLSAHLSSKLLAWAGTKLLQAMPPVACMLPLYAYAGLIVAENVSLSNILPDLVKELGLVQKRYHSQLLSINPVVQEEQSQLANWEAFMPMPIVDDAILDIEWDSYDAYQMWLPSKKRAEIRRVRNRAADAGVHVEEWSLEDTDASRIEELMRMVTDRHQSSYMLVPDAIEKAANQLHAEDYRHLVALHNNKIVGTLTLFHSQGVVLVRWAGLDYPITQKTYTYHLLMSETVRVAIDMKATQLKLGGTVFTLKKQLGARLQERSALLRLRQPLLNQAMRQVLEWRQAQTNKDL